jgi:hypothetical protein
VTDGGVDPVIINYSGGAIVIPRASRDELVDQFSHHEWTKPIADAFLHIGGFRAVVLTRELEPRLFNVLEQWVNQVGIERMPDGLWDLRIALGNGFYDRTLDDKP